MMLYDRNSGKLGALMQAFVHAEFSSIEEFDEMLRMVNQMIFEDPDDDIAPLIEHCLEDMKKRASI
jgi:hypothetical protein